MKDLARRVRARKSHETPYKADSCGEELPNFDLPFPIETSLSSPMARTKFCFLPEVLMLEMFPSRDKKLHG